MDLEHFQILKHKSPNIPGSIQTQTENGYTVCLVMQAPIYEIEVKFYHMFQVRMRHL